MVDLRQQAFRTRRAWAHYKTWLDDPENHVSTRRTLGVIVFRLDLEALRLDAMARQQEQTARLARQDNP